MPLLPSTHGRFGPALASLAFLVFGVQPLHAETTLFVNDGSDVVGLLPGNGRCETAPGNGVCTLRRALVEAEQLMGRGPSQPADVTIVVGVPGAVVNHTGGPSVSYGTLSIVGSGQGRVFVETSTPTGVTFNGLAGSVGVGTLRVSALTIRNLSGAAITGTGNLTLDYVTIADSDVGLVWTGHASVTGCEFRSNGTPGSTRPGAIHFTAPSPPGYQLRIRRSSFNANQGRHGGALDVLFGGAHLEDVTFSGNHALGDGGAVFVGARGSLRSLNTTFSGNSAAGSGGAVFVDADEFPSTGQVVFTHTTLTANQAGTALTGTGEGGGIAVSRALSGSPRQAMIDHTILAGNLRAVLVGGVWTAAASDCSGALAATGPTLLSIVDCTVAGATTPTVGPANLGPLQSNGGLTSTHLPLVGSAAIDGGLAGPCRNGEGGSLALDQRGWTRAAGQPCDLGAVETGGALVTKAKSRDLDGDGHGDLLWQQPSTGRNAAWLMNGPTIDRAGLLTTVGDPTWKIVASDDFDRDGKADLLWHQSTTGSVAVWLMDGLALREAALLLAAGPTWQVAGTGDVDSDGRADVVWQRVASVGFGPGETVVWLLDGTAFKGYHILPNAGVWRVAGLGDMNGDGTTDLLWRQPATGETGLWLLANGGVMATAALPSVTEADWSVEAVTDMTGDGKADVLWQNPSGQLVLWVMNGDTVAATGVLPTRPAGPYEIGALVDLDNDARDDIVWRAADGRTLAWRMDGIAVIGSAVLPTVTDWELK